MCNFKDIYNENNRLYYSLLIKIIIFIYGYLGIIAKKHLQFIKESRYKCNINTNQYTLFHCDSSTRYVIKNIILSNYW